jgi:hypothetical protein
MKQPPIAAPVHLSVTPLDDDRYRIRLSSLLGPFLSTGVLSFGQLVDILRAWHGPMRTESLLVVRLVEMAYCTLITRSIPLPSEPIAFAA